MREPALRGSPCDSAFDLEPLQYLVVLGFHSRVLFSTHRFHLYADAVQRVPKLQERSAYVKQFVRGKLVDHLGYITIHGQDMPEIRDWVWPF